MIIGSKKKVKITGEDYEVWVQKIEPNINPKDVYGIYKSFIDYAFQIA